MVGHDAIVICGPVFPREVVGFPRGDKYLLIYAPSSTEVRLASGRALVEVGYHVRDYSFKRWKGVKRYPSTALAHSAGLESLQAHDPETCERPRLDVALAAATPERRCSERNKPGYLRRYTVVQEKWTDRKGQAGLMTEVGGVLHRLRPDLTTARARKKQSWRRGCETRHRVWAAGKRRSMNILDTKIYRWMEFFSKLVLLNLLWLLACIPVFTIYPSTGAMFAVVRQWVKGDDVGVLGGFYTLFKGYFRQSLWIGVLWTMLGAALAADIFFLFNTAFPTGLRIPLLVLTIMASFVYLGTSVYLFPVMVSYTVGWRTVLRNSLLFAVAELGTTIACLLVIATATAITVYVPITAVIVGSLTAYLVYRLCDASFQKVAALKDARNTRDQGNRS